MAPRLQGFTDWRDGARRSYGVLEFDEISPLIGRSLSASLKCRIAGAGKTILAYVQVLCECGNS